jgi:hypothetical protein
MSNPNDAHRLEALEQHFKADPGTFARDNGDPTSAKALNAPANESENFLR